MPLSPDFLREMRPGEEAQVEALLTAAFGGPEEAALVRALRKAGDMVGEQVMTAEGAVIAYAGLSRMVAPKGWLCLAPVAVHPDWQGRRVGKRMVGLIAEWARLSGRTVVVLGQVDFYSKAGFSAARAARLTSPYPVEHTLLAGPGDTVPAETLVYPRAFG
ncbi:GNAT family N-acetyltransferase [Seohaeicola zhoushanensis]|uniref:N-acetyltransferase n=1 Tax=Seohaeicola zhoushanensis TaxID=1569283 RepID=A0A8J3GXQ8_9RHOB|nr:N-acetyltransferase [Seohaeicola zhoushanensis]GHF54812.1 N-acetyltransferase [Seohaeicola zhoushanensis]